MHKAFGATLYKLKEMRTSRNCRHITKSFVTCAIAQVPLLRESASARVSIQADGAPRIEMSLEPAERLKIETEEWVSG